MLSLTEIVHLRRQINEERIARHKAEQKVVEVINEERIARHKAEQKLTLDIKKSREENNRLRRSKGSILDDDSVLDSIEASFKQFHEFLDLLRDAGLGQLITMAGLDAKGSPFNQNVISRRDADDRAPKFPKKSGKANGYLGDISSSNQINNTYGLYEKTVNGNVRPTPYLSTQDPTMKSHLDEETREHEEAQTKRDELYERILQETSSAFRHIGEMDLTVDVTGDTTQTQESTGLIDTIDENDSQQISPREPKPSRPSKLPQLLKKPDRDTREIITTDLMESLKGPGGEIIMSFDLTDDDVVQQEITEIPGDVTESRDKGRHGQSHVSDFSYRMDSFEQSYVSERGEVVHLGDEMDFYPQSPSPIGHESEDDDF